MPLIPFDRIADQARVWTFSASRPLTQTETATFLEAVDTFLVQWTAHKVPLATARDWRLNQFLLVAVDESAAGASGCSIDALVRFMREAERGLGVRLTDNGPVWFRGKGGGVESVSRGEFQRLADSGAVGPDTIVFDGTVETVEAVRRGRWEVPAKGSWHGRAFFADQAAPAR